MKYLTITFLFFCWITESVAQKPNPEELLKEGKLLYRLEKVSWFSTDHFLANFTDKKDSIGGYLSYEGQNGQIYSIFFSRFDNRHILVRYTFESAPTPNPISIDTINHAPVDQEADLIAIRQDAINSIRSNEDGFYSFYENTSFNPVPIISANSRKVYLLTGPQYSGYVILGNDYLLQYNTENVMTSRVKLHNTIIELPYSGENGQMVTGTMHSHILSNHIEVTDICTLLLYRDFVEWKQHYVIHNDFVSILDLETENLAIMTKKAFDKIKR